MTDQDLVWNYDTHALMKDMREKVFSYNRKYNGMPGAILLTARQYDLLVLWFNMSPETAHMREGGAPCPTLKYRFTHFMGIPVRVGSKFLLRHPAPHECKEGAA